MYGTFVLDGNRFLGINDGPAFQFSEVVSFMVNCKDQRKIVVAELEDAVAAV